MRDTTAQTVAHRSGSGGNLLRQETSIPERTACGSTVSARMTLFIVVTTATANSASRCMVSEQCEKQRANIVHGSIPQDSFDTQNHSTKLKKKVH
jgi:hypothetical protein